MVQLSDSWLAHWLLGSCRREADRQTVVRGWLMRHLGWVHGMALDACCVICETAVVLASHLVTLCYRQS